MVKETCHSFSERYCTVRKKLTAPYVALQSVGLQIVMLFIKIEKKKKVSGLYGFQIISRINSFFAAEIRGYSLAQPVLRLLVYRANSAEAEEMVSGCLNCCAWIFVVIENSLLALEPVK